MTSDNAQRSVLLIGKSQLVLDESVAGLRGLDHKAEATNNFSDVTGRFDVNEIDLVVFGGQVPPDRKEELREEIAAINPGVIFVHGLAGIPGLIVNQVQGAFAANHQDPARAPTYTPDDRSIRLTLAGPADVQGDRLVADLIRAARSQERFAPAHRREARWRRSRDPSPRSRPAQGRLRHRAARRGDLRLQHRHGAMTASRPLNRLAEGRPKGDSVIADQIVHHV
jgi:hypothetical protein